MKRKRIVAALAAALGVVALIPVATAVGSGAVPFTGDREIQAATALGTGFTYQGRLTDAGSPANATYDIRFILYDAETGGAQVGTVTIAKEDVSVVNGLFSVDLDFGATAFNGDARWLEIAVRPGTSTATHTVLSPRQPVSPTPYALYAKAAGSLALPFAASAAAAGVSGNSTGLLTVTQSGTGIALSGQRTTVDPADFPAVVGTNSGGGAAVQGISTFATGIGGKFSGTTGVQAVNTPGGGTALDINNGALMVSGLVANRTAFQLTTTALLSTLNYAVIDSTLTNNDPAAMVFIEPVFTSSAASTVEYGVFYTGATGPVALQNKWAIFDKQGSNPITVGTKFNVLVIKGAP